MPIPSRHNLPIILQFSTKSLFKKFLLSKNYPQTFHGKRSINESPAKECFYDRVTTISSKLTQITI